MRWSFINFPSFVLIDEIFVVHIHFFVGINTDTNFSDVSINVARFISDLQIGQKIVHVYAGQEDKVPHPSFFGQIHFLSNPGLGKSEIEKKKITSR